MNPAKRFFRSHISLIATDLDGTLLHDDKTVSPRTVAALAAAEAAGIEVLFVTGRPPRWMDLVREHVHGHGMAICANGASVVDLHRGQLLEVRPLATEDALAVVNALRATAPGTTFAVERSHSIHYEPGYPPFHSDPGATVAPIEKLLTEDATEPERAPGAYGEPGPSTPALSAPATLPSGTSPSGEGASPSGGAVRTAGDVVVQPVVKLLAQHPELEPDAFLALARAEAGNHGEITRSSPTALLEIMGRGVSKASTLARYCAERGIGPEQVLALGDMPNDLEMLTWAGTSYAMANAHPDVLAATTGHTLSNEDDGVAVVVEDLLATQPPRTSPRTSPHP